MPKQTNQLNPASVSIGSRLFEALTQQEIIHLLDAVFASLPSDSQSKMLAHLRPDTRQTVQHILSGTEPAGPAAAPATTPVSVAKLGQIWAGLWQDWDRIVDEATEEDGDYITQEHHWEEPYFDETAFIEDLEQVAGKMRPLIPVAILHHLSPYRSLAEALTEMEADVSGGIPEWIYVERFSLEANLTFCLLEWEWLNFKQEEDDDAFVFAREILDYENDFSRITLDSDTCLDFLTELPETDQRNIFAGLTQHQYTSPWAEVLQNTYSHWHAFYMHCIEQYAPERYLDALRATIPQQWPNGLPVIEDFLAKKAYREGLQVVEETLKAMLTYERVNEAWTPETSLLFTLIDRQYGDPTRLQNHKQLLDYYRQVAQGLDQPELVHTLALQLSAFDHSFNWETMLKAFAEATVSQPTRQALFASWRDYIIRRAKPYTGGFGWPPPRETTWWLHWLIDSVADPQKGPAWFQQQMNNWLAQLPGEQRALGEEYEFLRLLTKDLTEISGNKKQFPKFYETVIRPNELTSPDQASRQAYLRQSAQPDLLAQVMAYWQGHLQNFVPKPEQAHKSDYTSHAQWMAALRELAPDSYTALLEKWRVEHHRRRNLWAAMARLGLG